MDKYEVKITDEALADMEKIYEKLLQKMNQSIRIPALLLRKTGIISFAI